MAGSNKRLRLRLLAQDPHCYWCGSEVVEYNIAQMEHHGPPDNQATLDHLFDKWEPEKRFSAWKEGVVRHVLACHRCNQKRNKERMKHLNKDAVRIRSTLGQERKKLLSTQPRPQVFRGLEKL